MSKPVCLLWLDDFKSYEQALDNAGIADRFELHCVKREDKPPEDLIPRLEVLAGWKPGGLLGRMPKLRWVQAMTAGVEAWLGAPGLRDDVALCCARGSHRHSMSENILGALFHLTKPYMAVALDQKASRWNKRQSTLLAGQTLGILGLGAIGQELALKAAALEMRVIGTKRSPEPVEGVEEVYAGDETDDVLRQSDFVVLLMPATAETDNFINTARLKVMKPNAWLLNFARGSLVNDDDLIAAVKNKTIAGAVLDVFREEPLPAIHPFWTTENILVLPHIGGGHAGRGAVVAEIFAENARCFLAGEPFATEVDRARGY
ncbi:MAG: D-2-hydroxyacid dehydrogenase [Burkholderiales bacterium]|jgi:phosphoglycerate dehydrogenase-like enzyme|nr:D-2-hydroxyacid dehydrogenase [Burkholderiales bacterium]